MKNFVLSVIISALITSAGLWCYDRYYATHIAVFDMEGYINNLKKDFVAGKLPSKEIENRIAELKTLLEANAPNTVILLKEVVLSGKVKTIGDGNSKQE